MKRLLCLVFGFLLLLSGCRGYKELNELQIVAGLYLDLAADGTIKVTAETVEFTAGTEKSAVYSAEGSGIRECLTRMMESCGQELYLSHAEVIAVSQAYADARMRELTEYIIHEPGLRFTTAIVISQEPEASMLLETPEYGDAIRTYVISSLLQNSSNTGYSIIKESYAAIRELYDIGGTTVLPTVSVQEGKLRTGGCAVLGKNGTVFLNDAETMLLNLLTDKLDSGSYGFMLEQTPVSVGIKDCRSKITCTSVGPVVQYRVDTTVSLESQLPMEAEVLANTIRADCHDAVYALYDLLRSVDADAFGVARSLRGLHPEQYRTMDPETVFSRSVLVFALQIHTGEATV